MLQTYSKEQVDKLVADNERLTAEGAALRVILKSVWQTSTVNSPDGTAYRIPHKTMQAVRAVIDTPASDKQTADDRQLPDEGNTWQCGRCGEINAGAFCPCSYEVQDEIAVDPEQSTD